MKYLVFIAASLALVPIVTVLASTAQRYRTWLLGILIFSTVIGDLAGVNFLSAETYRGPDRGFEVTLTDLLAWGLAISMYMRHGAKLRFSPPGTITLSALFLVGLISAAIAPVPLYSAFTLWKWLRLFVVYLVIVNSLALEFQLVAVRYGLTAIGAVITFLAVKQKYVDHIYRIPGPFDHSNTIPLYVNLILPLLLVWALTDRTLKKWEVMTTMVCVFGMLFAVVATYSRAGMALSGMCAFGAMLVANLKGRTMRAGIASGLVLLLLIGGGVKAAGSIATRIATAPKASEEARDEFNQAADQMALDHPFGVGLNNFSRVLSDDARYNRYLGVMKNEAEAGVCHHIYRLTAAELGYGGLAIFVVLLLRFAGIALRWSWSSRTLEAALLAGQLLGFVALHLSGFFEWAFRITPVAQAFTIHCALVVALAARVQATTRRNRRITPKS